MSVLVLSLFPGIGLFDAAFEAEGFCVVRGPDLIWGGDVGRFSPPAGRFDGVIGGPPCQTHSPLAALVRHNGGRSAPCKISEFERVVAEADPRWFVMENVVGAPAPGVSGYAVQSDVVRDYWCGGVTLRRRRFSFGLRQRDSSTPLPRWAVETLALHRSDPEPSALASGSEWCAVDGRPAGSKTRETVKNHLRKQGLRPDFFDHSPFTVREQVRLLGNGVPLALGRAVARSVRSLIYGAGSAQSWLRPQQ